MSEQEMKVALEATVPGLEVWSIHRPNPTLVRGTIDGHKFCFRASGMLCMSIGRDVEQSRWSRGVMVGEVPGWYHEERYESDLCDSECQPYSAGNMPQEDVIACIVNAVGLWRVRSDPRGPSRLFVPAEAMQNDALILGLHHIGATEEQTIESLAKDRARLLDELARCKEKSTWPVVFVMKQAEVKI